MIRRLAVIKFVNGKQTFEEVRTISKEEWDDLIQMGVPISRHVRHRRIYQMVERNGNDFLQHLKKSTNVTSLDEEDEILFEANRLLMNFLAMCFSYVEHIKHRIFEQYGGKESKTYKDFDNFRRLTFDTFFSYRFFYKLRNYAVHNDIPITFAQNNIESGLKLYFSRDDLIKWDGWGRIVGLDLQQAPEYIEIEPHVKQMMAIMTCFFLEYMWYYKEELNQSIQKLQNLMIELNHEPILMSYQSYEAAKQGNASLTPLPYRHIHSVIEDLKRHPNININVVKVSKGEN